MAEDVEERMAVVAFLRGVAEKLIKKSALLPVTHKEPVIVSAYALWEAADAIEIGHHIQEVNDDRC